MNYNSLVTNVNQMRTKSQLFYFFNGLIIVFIFMLELNYKIKNAWDKYNSINYTLFGNICKLNKKKRRKF